MKIFLSTRAVILWIVLLITTSIFAQQKGILLEHKRAKRVVFMPENKRIKIKTIEGKTHVGRFQILDSATIVIDKIAIPLTSIVKIKQRSGELAVLRNVIIGAGAILLTAGITAGFASTIPGKADNLIITYATIPFGLPLFVLPLTSNKHSYKRWNYKISTLPPDPFVIELK